MMGCGFIFHPHLIKDGDPFHSILNAVLDSSELLLKRCQSRLLVNYGLRLPLWLA